MPGHTRNVAPNPAPAPGSGAPVVANFPVPLIGASWTCAGAGGGICTASGTGNINDLVNLPVGGTATYMLTATVSPSATFGMNNTVTITPPAGVTDPNPANNSARDVDNICSASTFSYFGPPVPIPDAADLTGNNPGPPANTLLSVRAVTGPITDINLGIDGPACEPRA